MFRIRLFIVFVFVVIFMIGFSARTLAEDTGGKTTSHQEIHEKEFQRFNPSEFLFEHISDAHEWHVFSYKGKHYSIPLPVILISKNNGLIFFWSGKLHHGYESHFSKGYEYRLEAKGEHKGHIVEISEAAGFHIPLDISITKNILAMFFSIAILLWLFISIARAYKRNPGQPPRGIQSLFEPIILFVRDEIAKPSIGHKYEKFTPYLLTIFFFIWFNNMLGLIPIPPGGANLTGNIAVTGVLALFTMITVNFSGNRNYWKHIFNTPGVPIWLKIPPVMPLIELFGVITKPFVLMIRLFANITAGHLITLGFLSLIFVFGELNASVGFMVSPLSLVFLLFMLFLELLVAFIQAFVFTFLSALYIGMAVEEHH
ncbi:MAG: F0F1 ATP synthase subunit A [Bacteroidales bacterium]